MEQNQADVLSNMMQNPPQDVEGLVQNLGALAGVPVADMPKFSKPVPKGPMGILIGGLRAIIFVNWISQKANYLGPQGERLSAFLKKNVERGADVVAARTERYTGFGASDLIGLLDTVGADFAVDNAREQINKFVAGSSPLQNLLGMFGGILSVFGLVNKDGQFEIPIAYENIARAVVWTGGLLNIFEKKLVDVLPSRATEIIYGNEGEESFLKRNVLSRIPGGSNPDAPMRPQQATALAEKHLTSQAEVLDTIRKSIAGDKNVATPSQLIKAVEAHSIHESLKRPDSTKDKDAYYAFKTIDAFADLQKNLLDSNKSDKLSVVGEWVQKNLARKTNTLSGSSLGVRIDLMETATLYAKNILGEHAAVQLLTDLTDLQNKVADCLGKSDHADLIHTAVQEWANGVYHRSGKDENTLSQSLEYAGSMFSSVGIREAASFIQDDMTVILTIAERSAAPEIVDVTPEEKTAVLSESASTEKNADVEAFAAEIATDGRKALDAVLFPADDAAPLSEEMATAIAPVRTLITNLIEGEEIPKDQIAAIITFASEMDQGNPLNSMHGLRAVAEYIRDADLIGPEIYEKLDQTLTAPEMDTGIASQIIRAAFEELDGRATARTPVQVGAPQRDDAVPPGEETWISDYLAQLEVKVGANPKL